MCHFPTNVGLVCTVAWKLVGAFVPGVLMWDVSKISIRQMSHRRRIMMNHDSMKMDSYIV